MSAQRKLDGWTLNQGLAAQYAAQAGLDPDLAADAGKEVWDVLKSLRDAASETDPKRQAKLVKRAKARLAKAGLSRHGELVQHIEAKLLALQGRGGDTELAHLTPGEVIVPPQLQTPKVVQALQKAAHNAGVDMTQYTAGSHAGRVNPETGLAEYDASCQLWSADCHPPVPRPIGGEPGTYDYDWGTHVHVTGGNSNPGGNSYQIGPGFTPGTGIGAGIGGGYDTVGEEAGGDASLGNRSEYEYGTPQNPASDPPEGIDQYNFVVHKDGTTSFTGPYDTISPEIDLSGGIGARFPGSHFGRDAGGGDLLGNEGVPGEGNIDTSPPISQSLRDVLTDPSEATDAELEQAVQDLRDQAINFFGALAIGTLTAPPHVKAPVGLGGMVGGGTYFGIMANRLLHEIQNRIDAGVWTGEQREK